MSKAETRGKTDQAKIAMSEEEWRSKLTPEQFYVTREHGTERAFSHPYYEEKDAGMYRCVCGGARVQLRDQIRFRHRLAELLRTGEPRRGQRARRPFVLHASHRGSLRATCDAHLGHVFPDGPKPTGARYCINGVALQFDKDAKPAKGQAA